MSYTVVKDDEWYARQYENRLNAVVRRCKIGRVTNKPINGIPEWLRAHKPYRQPKDTFFIPPYDPIGTWIQNGTVMDHPRNCAPFISAFTAANA